MVLIISTLYGIGIIDIEATLLLMIIYIFVKNEINKNRFEDIERDVENLCGRLENLEDKRGV